MTIPQANSRASCGGRPNLRPDSGFTLLETLVAVMVLSVAVVVVLELFSANLRSADLSDDYTRGVTLARAKMEELLLAKVPPEGDLAGRFEGGFEWTASYSPYGEAEEDGEASPAAHTLAVEVTWPQGGSRKRVTLTTLTLATGTEED